ncbi:MAG: FkbM family methyltransferase [Candidatus Liptonbacteria bacterium]|nr:FkbM family methyltransferase [Candidatus Liptonbacteria bacterium]
MLTKLSLLVRGILTFKDWHLWVLDRFKLLDKSVPRLFRLRNGISFLLVQEGEIEQGFGSFQEIFIEDRYNKYYKLKPGDTVLDIGSGIGEFLVYSAKRGAKATGYETIEKRLLLSKVNLSINKCNAEVSLKKVTSLDDIAGADFLKMDIEGGEFEVFKNTKDLRKFRNIAMEFHASPEHIEEKLKAHGFGVKTEYVGEKCGYLYAIRK